MTKAKISEYDAVAANNTDVNGVNIAENCPPSGMNNMGREIMAALKRFQTGADGDSVTVGGSLVVSGTATTNTLTAGPVSATTLNTSGAVVFNDAGADVDFRVEGDTEANLLFVDASTDRVGIGTNAPSAPLHVRKDQAAATYIMADNVGTVGASTSYGFACAENGAVSSFFRSLRDGTGEAQLYNSLNAALRFGTNNTERMRIDSSGRMLVGLTSTDANSGGARFQLLQSNNSWVHYIANTATTGDVYGQYIQFQGQAPNDTTSLFLYCGDNGLQRASIRSNGGLANYQANNANLSDRREKTNFAPAKNYLETICSIPVQTFNYIDQNHENDPGLTLGVVAQDVQEVAPELVMESDWSAEKDGSRMRLSIYQTDLQYALMKCIQELKAELDAAKERIAALENA